MEDGIIQKLGGEKRSQKIQELSVPFSPKPRYLYFILYVYSHAKNNDNQNNLIFNFQYWLVHKIDLERPSTPFYEI